MPRVGLNLLRTTSRRQTLPATLTSISQPAEASAAFSYFLKVIQIQVDDCGGPDIPVWRSSALGRAEVYIPNAPARAGFNLFLIKKESILKTNRIVSLLFSFASILSLASLALAADPGSPVSLGASNDQQAGSILVYNYYTSTATGSDDTRFSMTNMSHLTNAYTKLFFVANTGEISTVDVCLTPNQTTAFLSSDVDPGSSGYVIAVSINENGVPNSFNNLIGSASISLASGHRAKLNAVCFQALYSGALSDTATAGQTISLDFDGVKYTKAPRVLTLDTIPSRVDGNDTRLIVNSFGGNLSAGITPLGELYGLLFDDAESIYSFLFRNQTGPQLSTSLQNSTVKTTPRIETVIPAGRSGWLKIGSFVGERAITGASLNFGGRPTNPDARNFTGGSNLHHSTVTAGNSSIVMPISLPTC